MQEEIKEIEKEFLEEVKKINSLKELEVLRAKYLGRKGVLSGFFSRFSQVDVSQRAILGEVLNSFKERVQSVIKDIEERLERTAQEGGELDVTLPGVSFNRGVKHILTQTIESILSIFETLGFVVVEGSEIETEYYNFTALNIPPEHPATEAFHTFYLSPETTTPKKRCLEELKRSPGRYLLRSQTSTVQVRIMEQFKPPLRVVSPGRVYRPDATDASHSFMFHQIEGFAVGEGIRFSDLKGTLFAFAQRFFGKDIKMRFRPHHFPFTEPSVEVDISCIICKGKGCSVCGRKGWLEILGAGMVHPRVFYSAGYPSGKYRGFAFGMGVERIAMLKYGIDDIRLFFENDLRFLRQF
ncbi:MAG: phenylalanine--tRNA ligase subunit alpha [Candidatus Omnitrophica bacterium]|nr:phenylalanine--tRNA ligase subunit alpha [Candidatus Omnitrophota bacterium]